MVARLSARTETIWRLKIYAYHFGRTASEDFRIDGWRKAELENSSTRACTRLPVLVANGATRSSWRGSKMSPEAMLIIPFSGLILCNSPVENGSRRVEDERD
jgi:hypothetical protein